MTEGFPSARQDDLRYYLDSCGKFTRALRRDYAPLRRAPDQRIVYVKVGSVWTDSAFDLLTKGSVFRVLDTDGMFIKWADDGSVDMFALDDPVKNREGMWGVRTRKPTAQEIEDA